MSESKAVKRVVKKVGRSGMGWPQEYLEVYGLRVLVTLTQVEDGTRRGQCPVFHGQRMAELWYADGSVDNIPEEAKYMFQNWKPTGQGPTAKAALDDLINTLKKNHLHGTLRVAK